jgi:glucose/arabinose dehydrogenase
MTLNMKKTIEITIALIVIVLIAVAWYFYQGARPAVAPSDIEIDETGEVISDNRQQITDNRKDELGGENKLDVPLIFPEDFNGYIYAGGLGKVRDVMEAPDGILVTSMAAGKVVYLPDRDKDMKADEQIVLLTDRYNPHGLAEYCIDTMCKLFVAETDAIYRFDYDKVTMNLSGEEKIVDLPDTGGHYTRHVLIDERGEQAQLLITVGSECNVCEEEDWRRAKILVADLDGSNLREYASGLRNSVFMTTSPFTGDVYATDMGRDWLGDNLPPEEVNVIAEGQDYGWPICYGDKVHDTDFDKKTYIRNPCEDTVGPVATMPAHAAPLGLSFIPEPGFSEEYWHDLLVVQHGSWNRSTPVGYEVVRMKMDRDGNYLGTEKFLHGFLRDGEAWGRPADVLAVEDGKIYVSDDKAGAVYLLTAK